MMRSTPNTIRDGCGDSRSPGSEGGTIVLDEEHADGARITLEQDGSTASWPLPAACTG
jgi:hypothetical protein